MEIAGTDAPMCPNAVRAVIAHNADVTSTCNFLFGSSLKTVELSHRTEGMLPTSRPNNPEPLLRQILEKAPGLERLTTEVQYPHPYPLGSMISLRILWYSGMFSLEIWKEIVSNRPNLEEFEYGSTWFRHVDSPTMIVITIPNIRSVNFLEIPDHLTTERILRWTAMPALRVCHVTLSNWENTCPVHTSIKPLVERSPLLEHLTIRTHEPLNKAQVTPLQTIQNLKCLRSLTLNVWTEWMDCAVAVLQFLPNGIPTLESLTITFDAKIEGQRAFSPAGLKLRDLSQIPDRLPSIRHLTVTVNADEVPGRAFRHWITPFENLESLHLDPIFAWSQDFEDVTHWLAEMYPAVREFEAKVALCVNVHGMTRVRQHGDELPDRSAVDTVKEEHALTDMFRRAQRRIGMNR